MKVCEVPDGTQLQLLSKVGFDGSSSQSVYKQACGDEEQNLKIEENLFLTCMVPVQRWKLMNEAKSALKS